MNWDVCGICHVFGPNVHIIPWSASSKPGAKRYVLFRRILLSAVVIYWYLSKNLLWSSLVIEMAERCKL